jgi:hypothetical protein
MSNRRLISKKRAGSSNAATVHSVLPMTTEMTVPPEVEADLRRFKAKSGNRDPEVFWHTVDPTWAAQALTCNVKNRPLSESSIAALVAAHDAGLLQEKTGDPIKFDWNGRLFGGQHRLHTIIRTGISYRVLIEVGIDPAAYTVDDLVRPKTAGDILHPEMMNARLKQEAATPVLQYRTGKGLNQKHGIPMVFKTQFMKDSDARLDAIITALHGPRLKSLKKSLQVALFYILVHEQGESFDDVSAFFRKLNVGDELTKNDPIFQARSKVFLKYIPKELGPSNAARNAILAEIIFKTYQLHRKNGSGSFGGWWPKFRDANNIASKKQSSK